MMTTIRYTYCQYVHNIFYRKTRISSVIYTVCVCAGFSKSMPEAFSLIAMNFPNIFNCNSRKKKAAPFSARKNNNTCGVK